MPFIPFKVVRCRYFDFSGHAVPPYCTLGRHCTFLHPGDKGWPGGDPAVPDSTKRPLSADLERSPTRTRSRSGRNLETLLNQTHPAAGARTSALFSDMRSDVSEYSQKNGEAFHRHWIKNLPPVPAIIKTFHDIAKFQNNLTQDKQKLERTTEKLIAFRELLESLDKINSSSAAAVKPALEAIEKNHEETKLKYERDARNLAESWEDALHIFLRAICRQFDLEIESGTDFLRQETRTLLSSLRSQPGSQCSPSRNADQTPSANQQLSSESNSLRETERGTKRNAAKMDDEDIGSSEGVNPPIGFSDNGWVRKKPRLTTPVQNDTEYTNENGRGIVVKLQQRLELQEEKIGFLMSENMKIQKVYETHEIERSTGASIVSIDSLSHEADGLFSRHIEPNLRQHIINIVAPMFEAHKQATIALEGQIFKLAEEMRNTQIVKPSHIEMKSSTPLQSPKAE